MSPQKAKVLLILAAKEDPNTFLQLLFKAACDQTVDRDELDELRYLIVIARRAVGYQPEDDPFRPKSLPTV